jgi:hypothetical protein
LALLRAMSKYDAGKDSPSPGGCQENIAKYAAMTRQSAK